MKIPEKFVERIKLIYEDSDGFLSALQRPGRKVLRVNKLRVKPNELGEIFEKTYINDKIELQKLGFCKYAFYFRSGFALSKTREFENGLFMLQDASSLLPVIALGAGKSEYVADFAAAPGVKTSHIAQEMRNTGAIIAMDNNLERIKTLKYTLEKIGCLNTVVLMQESEKFHSNRKFDRILVDAPCSSEALMFEERDAMANWSIPLIQRKAEMQKRMLSNAANLLGKKGTIVYSTCTTAPEENEAVVDYVLSQNPELRVEKLEFEKFKTRSGIAEWQGKEFNQQVKNCARICPQDNGSLAFFVAKIVKK